MGNGVDYMMYSHAWHGKAPNDDQLQLAMMQNVLEELSDY
jgi:transketolase